MQPETPDGPRLVWDIETDGLLDEMTKIHCIVAINPDTGEEHVFRPHQVSKGIALLNTASELIGHNIIGFDIPAIRKLYPHFNPPGTILDTLIMCRLHRPDLKDSDHAMYAAGKFPAHLINRQSLESWGWRLGTKKSEFGKTADWTTFTEQMLAYCAQDVRVNVELWHFLERQRLAPTSIELENRLATIIQDQEFAGFNFEKEGALKLQLELMNKADEITRRLRDVFKPWFPRRASLVTKTSRAVKMTEYSNLVTLPRFSEKTGKPLKPYVGPPLNTHTEGAEFTPIKLTEFNPGSREHVADRLQHVYGWKPTKFTAGGAGKEPKVQIDESILEALPNKLVPKSVKDDLIAFYAVNKILGMVGQGAQSWLRNIKPSTGRIHGRVITNGAITGRGTHRNPNIAQTPKVLTLKIDGKKVILFGYEGGWGWECRSLFIPQQGWELVGIDQSSLELRMLAHFIARFDGGKYAEVVTKGDPHEYHQGLIQLKSRDTAKTWIYAFIFGAGVWKLGFIADPSLDEEDAKALGKKLNAKLMKNFPALKQLKKAIKVACLARPYLIGLDGRRIAIRSEHSALNALLQSAGAVVCKRWIILLHEALAQHGYKHGVHFRQVAWVHDELQIECRPGLGKIIGEIAVKAAIASGESFGLKCPTAGEFKVGKSWAETH